MWFALTLAAALATGAKPVAAPPDATPAARVEPRLTGHDCGDFLARLGSKPAGVVFEECRYLPDAQGKPLRAVYRVPGRFAAAAEAGIVVAFRMRPLERSCCQWEARPVSWRDRAGIEYSIYMVSDETTVASRAAWPDIERFEIVIETFSEEI